MPERAEDLMQRDSFWDVREHERKEEEHLQRKAMEIQAQIDLASRTEQIRHAPGFNDFLVSVKALHALHREKLVGDDRLTNEGLREVRGRVRGLESVLAILTKPQITETLANQLAECKTQMAEALRRRPKKLEEPKVQS